jgi:hypothetical protein
MEIAIISIVVGLAVFLDVVATWTVRRSVALTRFQKGAQMGLVWMLPFVGSIVIISMLTDPEDRRRRQRWDPNDEGSLGSDGNVEKREADPHRGHWGDSGHGHGDGGQGGDGGGH